MSGMNADRVKLREFGIAMGLAFLAVSVFLLFRKGHAAAVALIIASCFFALAGLTAPSLLKPLYIASAFCGYAAARAGTMIVLFFLFYFVFTPLGLFMRLCGIDLLERKSRPDSYWKKSGETGDGLSGYGKRF